MYIGINGVKNVKIKKNSENFCKKDQCASSSVSFKGRGQGQPKFLQKYTHKTPATRGPLACLAAALPLAP